jgi:hypothetical protein
LLNDIQKGCFDGVKFGKPFGSEVPPRRHDQKQVNGR